MINIVYNIFYCIFYSYIKNYNSKDYNVKYMIFKVKFFFL